MTLVFWGIAVVLSLAAVGIVVLPQWSRSSGLRTPVALTAVVVPAVTLGLYLVTGSPDALTAESQDEKHRTEMSSPARSAAASVGELIDGLRARLEQSPEDAGGWLLLAQSYRHMGRHKEAAEAYQRAKSGGVNDASFDETMASTETGSIASTDRPKQQAVGPMIRGRVTLAVGLDLDPDDTVFIFAKESREHRLPVAAIRRPATELPVEFSLTNADAMIAGTDLGDYDALVVTARISRSGRATETLGGLEVWSEPVSPLGAQHIELELQADATTNSNTGGRGNE